MNLDERFLVIYARIVDEKDGGISLAGPFLGPICESEEKANKVVKDIINDSRNNSIIPKIYSMDGTTLTKIFEDSKPYFERLRMNIVESKEILESTTKRKKK